MAKAANINISRGMDFRKFVAAARELGVSVQEPGENSRNPHWILRCPEVHGNREYHLSTGRQDTPWSGFQWLRKIKEYRVHQERAVTKAARTAADHAVSAVAPESETADAPLSSAEVLEQLREAKLEAVNGTQRIRQASADIVRLEAELAAAKKEYEAAELDAITTEEAVDQLRKDLDQALDREIQGAAQCKKPESTPSPSVPSTPASQP